MSSDSTAVPSAAPVRRSFRQKLVREILDRAPGRRRRRAGQGARGAGGDRPARHGDAAPAGRGRAGARARRWWPGRSGSGRARPSSPRRRRSSSPAPAAGRRRRRSSPPPPPPAPRAPRPRSCAAARPRRPRSRCPRASGRRISTPRPPRRLVVYTTAFGAEPDPAPVFAPIPGLRFALPHRPARSTWPAGRRCRRRGARPRSPARAAAWCRIRPDLALAEAAPGAAASLYLALRPLAGGQPRTRSSCAGACRTTLALWRHPHGIDWQDLAEHALVTGARSRRRSSPRPRPARRAACRATAAPGTPG